ncbi:MAG: N-formylglutamate amidohydrolase, partial [Erythrobacter sp.]|nr:N-formylglutamate amidohydrolase [Erythrobacter sp.]
MEPPSSFSSHALSKGGGRISGDEKAAFTPTMPADLALPIVIGAPHGGRDYPDRVSAAMRDPDLAKLKLEDRLIDTMAEEIARASGAALIVAHAPRAMVDLNRSPDDIDWSMISGRTAPNHPTGAVNRRARSGLGLVPRRLPGMGEIWKGRLEREELDRRIDTIHKPYHAAL